MGEQLSVCWSQVQSPRVSHVAGSDLVTQLSALVLLQQVHVLVRPHLRGPVSPVRARERGVH